MAETKQQAIQEFIQVADKFGFNIKLNEQGKYMCSTSCNHCQQIFSEEVQITCFINETGQYRASAIGMNYYCPKCRQGIRKEV